MRAALLAVADELRRLKGVGVGNVPVTEEALAAVRRVVRARAAGAVAVTESADTPAEKTPVSLAPASPAPRAVAPAAAPVQVPRVAVPTLPETPVVTLPEGDKRARWDALLALVTGDPVCRANVRPGKKVVLGVGTLDARIMFVGEAPGAEEEIQGEACVGPAGQLLSNMILGMGVARAVVFIGNIMNWRPQMPTAEGREQVGNRPPTE
ncbi:MAG: uracil-DNA glycosylase family protein, partial [Opitutaceae bacterium]